MDNQPENNNSNDSQDVLAGYEQLKNQNRRRLIGAGAIAVLAGGLFAAVAGNGPKDNIEPKMANPQPQETATEILRPGGVASEAVAETHSLPPLPDNPQQNASVGETAQRQPESRPVPVQAAPVRPAEDEGISEAERRRIRREQQRLEQQQQREEAARKRAEARKAREQERLKAEQERIAKARADEQQRRQAQAIVAKAEAERAAEAKAAAERAARQKAAADEARKAERAKLMAQQKAADKAVAAKTEQAKDKPQNAKSAGRERKAVVQAGAFRDPNAAKQAQQKIKSLNYAAAIEEVSTDKGKIYRVKTGVFPSRAEAAAAAAKLKANGLGGIVLEQK